MADKVETFSILAGLRLIMPAKKALCGCGICSVHSRSDLGISLNSAAVFFAVSSVGTLS